MRPATRIVLAAAMVALVVAAVIVARRTPPSAVVRPSSDLPVLDAGPAPSLAAAAGWLNTRPLGVSDLAGKVVLYEFWTFRCINCQHTLSHVKAWYERYARDGFVVVAIHSPEFADEADPQNVRRYVTDQQIGYPVALDPEMRVWRAWHTTAWPTFWVYDRQGRARVLHIGEGGYEQTEGAIRQLLGVDPASPTARV